MEKKKSYIIKLKVDPDNDDVISISQTCCPWNPQNAKKHMTNALKNALESLVENKT